MSIYLFKTEEFYGGETKLFTNKLEAETYLAEFFKRTNDKIDAMIEEHPFPHVVVPQGAGEVTAYNIELDAYNGRFDGLDSIDVQDLKK